MVERFLTYLRVEKRYSPLTVAAYGKSIGAFCDFLGVAPEALDPRLMKTDDLRAWIMELGARKMAAASVNRHLSALRSFCRFLRREGVLTADPSAGVRLQKKPAKLPAHIERSRMEHITSQLDGEGGDSIAERDRLIILLFYATGIRLAELIAIDRDDFSAGFTELRVHGKGDRQRIVPLLESVRGEVRRHIEKINCENICESDRKALFLGKNGRRISRSEVYRLVNRTLAEAGVQGKRSPHVLRHTFATHLLDNGADLREIQELLGHRSLAATQIYTHNTISKLRETYQSAHPRATHKHNK